MVRLAPILVALSSAATPARAIVAGDLLGSPSDSPAQRVDPNTTTSPFAGVGSVRIFSPTEGAFICSGVLITRSYVLTAAHCLDLFDNGTIAVVPADVTFRLNFGGNLTHIIAARSLHMHPDFTGYANPSVNDDIAILRLSVPVPRHLPIEVPIYPLHTTPLVGGEEVTIVGYGRSGNGVDGYTVDPSFSVKRVGGNVIDQLDPDDEGTAALEVYRYDFDGPPGNNHIGGDTLGNDVETIIGGGDSAAPALPLRKEHNDGNPFEASGEVRKGRPPRLQGGRRASPAPRPGEKQATDERRACKTPRQSGRLRYRSPACCRTDRLRAARDGPEAPSPARRF